MYKRISSFLDINILTYLLQIGFRQKSSTIHNLTNLTESIRQTVDEGNFGCGIFVGLQMVFDTVDHKFLMYKLEYHQTRGMKIL